MLRDTVKCILMIFTELMDPVHEQSLLDRYRAMFPDDDPADGFSGIPSNVFNTVPDNEDE